MDNVNDIIGMLKDRLVEATRKTSRIVADMNGEDKYHYSFAEKYEAVELEEQLRSILYAITGEAFFWSEEKQAFLER